MSYRGRKSFWLINKVMLSVHGNDTQYITNVNNNVFNDNVINKHIYLHAKTQVFPTDCFLLNNDEYLLINPRINRTHAKINHDDIGYVF
jgi:hypothetical protein